MQKLAHLCLEGIGTKKDEVEGYHLLAMLANNNDEEALTLLRSAAMSGNHYAEYASLDLSRIIEGYKMSKQIQRAVADDRFGNNFDRIFCEPIRSIVPIPPSEPSNGK